MTQYPKRRAYGFQLLAAVGLRHSSWVDFSITQIWKIVQLLYKCPAPGGCISVWGQDVGKAHFDLSLPPPALRLRSGQRLRRPPPSLPATGREEPALSLVLSPVEGLSKGGRGDRSGLQSGPTVTCPKIEIHPAGRAA